MANLPLRPTIRVRNDLPSLRRKGTSLLESSAGSGSGPSLRLSDFSIDLGRSSTLGSPIGLLLLLTYASSFGFNTTGPSPVVRINSY